MLDHRLIHLPPVRTRTTDQTTCALARTHRPPHLLQAATQRAAAATHRSVTPTRRHTAHRG